MAKKLRPLTPRQEKFCQAYAKHGIGYKAIQEAGYDTNDAAAMVAASRMRRRENIQARLMELGAENENIASADEALELLTDIATDTEQKTADRINALNSLLKVRGMFIQKVESTVEIKGDPKLELARKLKLLDDPEEDDGPDAA